MNQFYFMGVDSAPSQTKKADDGALAILRAEPRPGIITPTNNLSDWLARFVWAYRLRGVSAREWSGFIHSKHRHFGLSGILMDSQGGGQWIERETIKRRQIIAGIEMEVTPIASYDSLGSDLMAQVILTMFRRRDPGIQQLWPHLAGDDVLYDHMHVVMQEAVEHKIVTWPKPFNERRREETEGWPLEKKWALKTLDAGRGQLINVQVVTKDNGEYQLTRNGAKQFVAVKGKKDLAYSMVFAYLRFLIWLKTGGVEFMRGSGSQSEGCSVF